MKHKSNQRRQRVSQIKQDLRQSAPRHHVENKSEDAVDAVRRSMVSMPFFRLDYRFDCPLDEIFDNAARSPTKRNKEFKTLEHFLRNAADELKKDKTKAFLVSRLLVNRDGLHFDKLEDHDEFLRQLSVCNFQIDFLKHYFQELRSFLAERMIAGNVGDVRHFRTIELHGLIFHLAKWRGCLSLADRTELILALEKILYDTHHQIKMVIDLGKISPAHVELNECLVFFYIVAIDLFEVGAHPSVIGAQIALWRSAGVSFWLELPSRLRLDHALVVVQLLVRHFPLSAPFRSCSGFSLNVFEGIREILLGARERMADAEYTYEKTTFDWFLSKLNQDIFVRLGYRETSILLQSLSTGEHGMIQDFAQRCYSYRYPVTIERIYAFLGQFPTLDLLKAAVRLLTHIRYIPMSRLGELVEDSLLAVAQRGQPAYVVPLGDLAGSTSIIRYLTSHSDRLPADIKVSSVEAALQSMSDKSDLIFADDCCLSGTQSIHTFQELLGKRDLKSHHTRHADKLDDALIEELKKRNLKFCFAVATDFGMKKLKSALLKLGFNKVVVNASHIEVMEQKLFDPHYTWLWRNRKEMESCKKFFQKVGFQVLGRRSGEKKWKAARRRKSALGFSDFQRLLVFEHNVPKTTLTALWESGQYEHQDWIPLFVTND